MVGKVAALSGTLSLVAPVAPVAAVAPMHEYIHVYPRAMPLLITMELIFFPQIPNA